MSYEYRVLSRGVSAFSNSLEGNAAILEELLNDQGTRQLTGSGWEVWRIEKFDEQGARGFLLILRRAN